MDKFCNCHPRSLRGLCSRVRSGFGNDTVCENSVVQDSLGLRLNGQDQVVTISELGTKQLETLRIVSAAENLRLLGSLKLALLYHLIYSQRKTFYQIRAEQRKHHKAEAGRRNPYRKLNDGLVA